MPHDPAVDVLLRHLEISEEKAGYWANFIAQYAYNTEPHMFDKKRDVENLENLERALTSILAALDVYSMTQSAQSIFHVKVLCGGQIDLNPKAHNIETLSEIIRNRTFQPGAKDASDALQALQKNAPIIREAIRSTKRHIRQSTDARIGTKRINFKGIQLVESARLVWLEQSGKPAPINSLNLASKFGMFLCDLFEALEVEGDPRSAFRAWAALQ